VLYVLLLAIVLYVLLLLAIVLSVLYFWPLCCMSFFWLLCCMSFFNVWIMITPLVSLNFSYKKRLNKDGQQFHHYQQNEQPPQTIEQ
jgi:MFS superfamily sulfate permease-like transporter